MGAHQDKYQSVVSMANAHLQGASVSETATQVEIRGTAEYQQVKDQIWDEIKKVGGESPADIMADIKVSNQDVYGIYEVQGGDSLSKIAKAYYGDPMEYQRIFKANTDKLDNPDLIHPGQELKIPFAEGKSADQG